MFKHCTFCQPLCYVCPVSLPFPFLLVMAVYQAAVLFADLSHIHHSSSFSFFILEVWTLRGFMSLLILKGGLSLPATHHILTYNDFAGVFSSFCCPFTTHLELLLEWRRHSLLHPHHVPSLLDKFPIPTVANGHTVLVSCMSLQSAKPPTDEKACHEFTCTHLRCGSLCCPLYCHLSSWMLMASDQAAVLSHSLQGVSPQSQIFKLFFFVFKGFFNFQADFFSQKYLGNFLVII